MDSFRKEEYLSLRREIETVVADLGKLERNCVYLCGAVYAWLATTTGTEWALHGAGYFVPLFFCCLRRPSQLVSLLSSQASPTVRKADRIFRISWAARGDKRKSCRMGTILGEEWAANPHLCHNGVLAIFHRSCFCSCNHWHVQYLVKRWPRSNPRRGSLDTLHSSLCPATFKNASKCPVTLHRRCA